MALPLYVSNANPDHTQPSKELQYVMLVCLGALPICRAVSNARLVPMALQQINLELYNVTSVLWALFLSMPHLLVLSVLQVVSVTLLAVHSAYSVHQV